MSAISKKGVLILAAVIIGVIAISLYIQHREDNGYKAGYFEGYLSGYEWGYNYGSYSECISMVENPYAEIHIMGGQQLTRDDCIIDEEHRERADRLILESQYGL